MNFDFRAGVAQSVERQPSKLNVAGSRPVSRPKPLVTLSATFSLFGAGAQRLLRAATALSQPINRR